MGNIFISELRKAATLPGIWVGLAVGILGTTLICVLNAVTVRSAVLAGDTSMLADTSTWENVFAAFPIGTVGAVILGVILMGSEYTVGSVETGSSRQVTTSILAVPSRHKMLGSKFLVAIILTFLMAAISISLCIFLANNISGGVGDETVTAAEAIGRCWGGILYWTLSALMALSITVLTRTVLIPLTILIVNSSLVSISYLLTKVTVLANYLPDMAGRSLFGQTYDDEGVLSVLPGSLVMIAWTVVLMVAASAFFTRKDA